MARRTQVKVTKEALTDWAVWLDGRVVGHFTLAGEALAYADLLECDPRARAEAGIG